MKATREKRSHFNNINTAFEIDYNAARVAEQHLEIPIPSIAGDIILVAMGLTYDTGTAKKSAIVKDKKWLPAEIVGARYRE